MAADNIINLIINQKADFQATLTVKENGVVKNLTGYSVIAEYKTDYNSPDSTAKSFDVVTNEETGTIIISLTYEQTSKLVMNQRYYYDIILINNDSEYRTRIAEGVIKVSPGVTI